MVDEFRALEDHQIEGPITTLKRVGILDVCMPVTKGLGIRPD
jgi:hypothetical protein